MNVGAADVQVAGERDRSVALAAVFWPTGSMMSRMPSRNTPFTRHAALHDEAVVGETRRPLRVELEVAGARVEVLRCPSCDDEERVALDGEVGVEAGRLEVALGEHRVDGADLHAESDLDRVDAALVTGRTAGALQQLREAFLERHAAGLEGDGVDVRDVVADHVHADLVVAKTGDAGKEGTHHGE